MKESKIEPYSVKEKFLIVDDVAKNLHVCTSTVARWINEGKLKARKVGRRWLISDTDYDEFVTKGVTK